MLMNKMSKEKFSEDEKRPWKGKIRKNCWAMLNLTWKEEIRNLKVRRKESEKQEENQDHAVPQGKSQARKKRDSRLSARSSKRGKEARKDDNPDVGLATLEVTGCGKSEARLQRITDEARGKKRKCGAPCPSSNLAVKGERENRLPKTHTSTREASVSLWT